MSFLRHSFINLGNLQKKLGGAESSGLELVPTSEFWYEIPSPKQIEFFSTCSEDLEILNAKCYPKGANFGISYKSWGFNSPLLLSSLFNYLTEQGVTFINRELSHIREAYLSSTTRIVFNCSGLGAKKLGGVTDDHVYPIRACVAVVKAPQIQENILFWSEKAATYALKRPHSKNELVLGGFYQPGNTNKDVLGEEVKDILRRATDLLPALLKNSNDIKDLDVIRTLTAFRPGRSGGVRIEKEILENGRICVHNYGAAGTGFAMGISMGQEAIDLAFKESFKL